MQAIRAVSGATARAGGALSADKRTGVQVLISIMVAFAALLWNSSAEAQGFGNNPVGPPTTPNVAGPPGAGGPAPGQPPPGTGAASGVGDAALPTEAATLPEDPLEIPIPVRKQIGTSADEEYEKGRGDDWDVDFYGLYFAAESDKYKFRTVFPLWAEREMPGDRFSMYSPFYFQRRSDKLDHDILFPFFWKLRDSETYTLAIGPWGHQETKEGDDEDAPGHANWLAPLFFEGGDDDGNGYLHIPPLFTFTEHSDHDGLSIVGPLFCSWRGGSTCDPRTTDSFDLGLAPFYFYGRDQESEYEIIPPLLHYYSYSDVGDEELNVWGPLWWERDREGEVFNILPIFWRNWGENEDHITIFPLFHYGYDGPENLLVTPLFVNANGEHGEHTFATWGYARHRGRTELDMVTPLFWWYRDPDIGLDQKYLLPFFYRQTSPRDDDLLLFPFYAHFEKPAIRETTWVTPFVRHSTSLTGWSTSVNPIFFIGRENRSTHFVFAPILWDFAGPRSRSTVVFPTFFRFADQDTTSQLALNTYYHEEHFENGESEWEFHFFPFFSYGESPSGHWWNFLYGIAGYTRDGTASKMRALYIPIELSE